MLQHPSLPLPPLLELRERARPLLPARLLRAELPISEWMGTPRMRPGDRKVALPVPREEPLRDQRLPQRRVPLQLFGVADDRAAPQKVERP